MGAQARVSPNTTVSVRCCAWRLDVLCARVYETLYGTWSRGACRCPDCGSTKAALLPEPEARKDGDS